MISTIMLQTCRAVEGIMLVYVNQLKACGCFMHVCSAYILQYAPQGHATERYEQVMTDLCTADRGHGMTVQPGTCHNRCLELPAADNPLGSTY